MKKQVCEVCGKPWYKLMSGIFLCKTHGEKVKDELAKGRKGVRIASIVRTLYRDEHKTGDYILRDLPCDLKKLAKQKALDDDCTVRDVIIDAMKQYLGVKE